MKTIFRYANVGLLVAAIMAITAVAGMAQNPCEDAEGIGALDAKFRAQYALTDLDGRKSAIDTGKQFLEKYGSCGESTKDLTEYLKTQIPKMEESFKKAVLADIEKKLVARFNTALATSNWDEVYPSGKELIANYGDKYRDVELALATIGYDESYNNKNFKYNDDTVKFAKTSIADLEGGKTFSANYGIPKNFVYKSKDNALGWMNLTIGYIYQVPQKNKKDALPYLYKATQIASETAKNPIPYELIGGYYFDELNKLVEQIKTAEGLQNAADTPEVAQKKVDDIKALVAMANGTSERAMDAYSRALTYALPTAAPYKAKMKKNVEDAYKLRFGKVDGVDAWIASVAAKPFPNPLMPIAPISDPEPVRTGEAGTSAGTPSGGGMGAANGSGIGKANGTGAGAANGSGVGGAKPATTTTKPATTTPAKPAGPIKPPAAAKPSAMVKKPVVKKKVG